MTNVVHATSASATAADQWFTVPAPVPVETDRIYFQLHHNGERYRFDFSLSLGAEKLLQAVKARLAFVVLDRGYELYWEDDTVEKNVLKTVVDLDAAICFAQHCFSESPCIYLEVVETGEEEQDAIEEAVYFSLAYKGQRFTFESGRAEEKLFHFVSKNVAAIVHDENYKLFWEVESSMEELNSEDDLFDAIALARINFPVTPCVYLRVVDDAWLVAPSPAPVVETDTVFFHVQRYMEIFKFGYPLCLGADQIFQDLNARVSFMVLDMAYELFWEDDVSEVVLKTVADLTAAIDHAKKNFPASPVVYLTVEEIDEQSQSLKVNSWPTAPATNIMHPVHETVNISQLEDAHIDTHQKAPVDLVEKARQLKMREKAVQLKEDIFARQMATLQVKMGELDEKLASMDARMDEVESKEGPKTLESRLGEMQTRLKKIEEKQDEDDIEIV